LIAREPSEEPGNDMVRGKIAEKGQTIKMVIWKDFQDILNC
jgi:hypothetical protein